MRYLSIKIAFFIDIFILFIPIGICSQDLPDTGQENCYDRNDMIITCPSQGAPLYGQDANFNINPISYTKICDGVVLDNNTKLYWEIGRNGDHTYNYDDPRDADNNYVWCDKNPNTNGGYAGNCANGYPYWENKTTIDFINLLNATNLGGFSDWRLPTYFELLSIIDYGRTTIPRINTTFFNDFTIFGYGFWTSSTVKSDNHYAWIVTFGGSPISEKGKKEGLTICRVRAVRGGKGLSIN